MGDVQTDEFLAHYGVKGMRWGYRKPGTGEPSSRKAARAEKKERVAAYKQAKSDHKKAAKAAFQKSVDDARASIESKEAKVDEARSAYKAAKKAEGRRSVSAFKAKQEWSKAAMDLDSTVETASQLRDGKEVARAILVSYAKTRV